MNGSFTLESPRFRYITGNQQPSESPQVRIIEGNISTSEGPRTNNTSLGNFNIQPHALSPLITPDNINAFPGDQSQATLGEPTSSKILTWTTISRTKSTHALSQANSGIVFNQCEDTDKPSNSKRKGTQRSSIESLESQPFSKVPQPCSSSTVSQINYFEDSINAQNDSIINNTSSHYVNILPEEPLPLLITDATGFVFCDEPQAYTDPASTASAALKWPSTSVAEFAPITTSAHTLSHENTDTVLNSAECTAKTPHFQSEETKKLPVLQQLQLPIADNAIDHSPTAVALHVKFTTTNIVLECLKNGEEMTYYEIRQAIKRRYPYIDIKLPKWKIRIPQLLVMERNKKIFLCRIAGSNFSGTKYWRINKMVVGDIRNLVILDCEQFKYGMDTLPFIQPNLPIMPSIDNPLEVSAISVELTFRNLVIECLQNKEKMTFLGICEEISKRHPTFYNSSRRVKNSINNILSKDRTFTQEKNAYGEIQMWGCWSINSIIKKNMKLIVVEYSNRYKFNKIMNPPCTVLQPNMPPILSMNNQSLISASSEICNLIGMITEHLKNGRARSCNELCKLLTKNPYITKTHHELRDQVKNLLKTNEAFEIKDKRSRWGLKESNMAYITPQPNVGAGQVPTPPSTIIQPITTCHQLISRGYTPIAMESQSDQ